MSVEDLLAHPLLWRGRDGGSAAEGGPDARAAIATGFAELDRYLPGGGWPLEGVSEIFIERYGLGELSILMPALAALSRHAIAARQWIVWVAPPFVPYAPALEHHGVDLSRILLVHPKKLSDTISSRKRDQGPFSGEALWAVEQVIRSQSSVAVLAWVREADIPALRRLQLGAEDSRCWTVLFRPVAASAEGSPAALRFRLSSAVGRSPAASAMPAERIPGRIGTRIEILKCRGRRPRQFVL